MRGELDPLHLNERKWLQSSLASFGGPFCAPMATVPSLKPTKRGNVSGQAGSQQPVQTVLNLLESIKGQNV